MSADAYGNPLSSTGSCYKAYNNPAALSVLGMIFVFCFIGNIVCFIARNDETVNNETTYISFGIMNFFQTFLVGIPLIVVTPNPTMQYVIAVAAIFIAFGGLTLLIFIPKVVAVEMNTGMEITITTKLASSTAPSSSFPTSCRDGIADNVRRKDVELSSSCSSGIPKEEDSDDVNITMDTTS